MNDSPVDCQSRDRLFRRKANPVIPTNKKDSIRGLFCYVKNCDIRAEALKGNKKLE